MGGASRCAGILEEKLNGGWGPAEVYYWSLKRAAVLCRKMDCGSPVSFVPHEVVTSSSSRDMMNLTCSGEPITDLNITTVM